MRTASTSADRQGPPFEDRVAAGTILAETLQPMLPDDAVVVGLARGGVVVAAEVAAALDRELDVVAVRKVGAPWQPEYALGAVAPGDSVYIRDPVGLDGETLERLVAAAQFVAEERDREFHAAVPPLALSDRGCVLVDDGLATGATMVAAIRWAKSRGAEPVIAAVPVGATSSRSVVERESVELVCPHLIEDFGAVGVWYVHFEQVEDSDVVRLLAATRRRAQLTVP